MAASLRATGTWARMVTDNGTVAIPGTPQAGDRMFLVGAWKTYSVTVANPAGWTSLGKYADGAVAAGNGTGSMAIQVWYRDWVSGDANPAIDYSAAPTEGGWVIQVWAKAAGETWDTPLVRNAAIAAVTAWTATASATVDVPSGGVVLGAVAFRDDSATMTRTTTALDHSAGSVTWNGNHVESPATHWSSTTGLDAAADLGHRFVTTGGTGVTLRMTGTCSAAETGAAYWIVQGVTVASNDRSGTASATFTTTLSGTGKAAKAQAAGTLASTATLAAQGRKAWAASAGTLALAATLAGQGRKGGRTAAGTLVATATLSGQAGRKGGTGTGSLVLAATLVAQGRKAATTTTTMALAATLAAQGRKAVSRAAGTLALGATLSATGRKGGIAHNGSGAGGTVAQDTFTGSVYTPLPSHTAEVGGTWTYWYDTGDGMFGLDGTGASAIGYSADGVGAWSAYLEPLADGWAQAYLIPNGSQRAGVFVRQQATNYAYMVVANLAGTVTLYRITNGAWTSLGTVPTTGNYVRLQATGSSPTALKVSRGTTFSGTWDLETTDATSGNQVASGNVGVYVEYDDWDNGSAGVDTFQADSTAAGIVLGAGTLVTGPATLAATGGVGVDARSGTGSMTLTPTLAASGRKGVARAAGTLAVTPTLAATGRKAVSRSAGTLAVTATLSWSTRKGARGLGSITLAATQAVAGRKGGRGQGSLAITPTFGLVGKHDGRAALGTWTLTPTLAAFGTSGASMARYGTGSMTLTPPTMSATGRKGGRGAGAITTSVSLAVSTRKGGKGSGTLALGAILATTARTARVGQALMPLEASLAAQARTSRYGVALQSATITWAVLGHPGRAGTGIMALVADMTATGLANARNLEGVEVAGSAQDAYAAGLASGDAQGQVGSGGTSARLSQDGYQARITEG